MENREFRSNQISLARLKKSKIEEILSLGGGRFGKNPLYVETDDAWKIWDHSRKCWITKLKINY